MLRAARRLAACRSASPPRCCATSAARCYGAIATFVDLTPLKRAEEHARQLDRLAALGRFTSSVAHEIRNPLTGIAAGVQYLSRSIDERRAAAREPRVHPAARSSASTASSRTCSTSRIRASCTCGATPLEDTVKRALQILEAFIAERGVEVSLEVEPRVPAVPHDDDQIQQVLINLIKNAVEALAGGRGECACASPPRSPKRAARAPSCRARPACTSQDDGTGHRARALRHIFEPFFTTKPGGTGLGLYISHDIVKRHGGALTVNSEPGRGTTFTVRASARA